MEGDKSAAKLLRFGTSGCLRSNKGFQSLILFPKRALPI